jgi:hypothetical protein
MSGVAVSRLARHASSPLADDAAAAAAVAERVTRAPQAMRRAQQRLTAAAAGALHGSETACMCAGRGRRADAASSRQRGARQRQHTTSLPERVLQR